MDLENIFAHTKTTDFLKTNISFSKEIIFFYLPQ